MRVEVNECHGPVAVADGAEGAERHRMVSADADQSGSAPDDLSRKAVNLSERFFNVERRHGHVARVHDLDGLERRQCELLVIGRTQVSRRGPDGEGPEAGARSERGATVEGHAKYPDVVPRDLFDRGQSYEGGCTGETGHDCPRHRGHDWTSTLAAACTAWRIAHDVTSLRKFKQFRRFWLVS
ncbi:MAG TPA: hypothetical protein VKU92_05780 [Acidimicrobiales bacterium]|nr:hypothetical protein [Acidimicrobiales bacterium]